MVVIFEEALLETISNLLMDKLPEELLAIEEGYDDSVRLPPFRYAGATANLPVGTGFPYALIDIEEGQYSEKDRIIKNVTYKVTFTLKLSDFSIIWRYFAAINSLIEQTISETWRIHIDHTNKTGVINISVVKK